MERSRGSEPATPDDVWNRVWSADGNANEFAMLGDDYNMSYECGWLRALTWVLKLEGRPERKPDTLSLRPAEEIERRLKSLGNTDNPSVLGESHGLLWVLGKLEDQYWR